VHSVSAESFLRVLTDKTCVADSSSRAVKWSPLLQARLLRKASACERARHKYRRGPHTVGIVHC
jgi:hypothetical protein